MPIITKKQLADYELLYKDRNSGRSLTPDGQRFICEALLNIEVVCGKCGMAFNPDR